MKQSVSSLFVTERSDEMEVLMNFRERLVEKIHLYDGSKGFLLMRLGLAAGDCPDLWNLEREDQVEGIHRAYVDAGADVIQTNTLQGSRFHLEARGLYEKLPQINGAGVRLAKKAAGKKALVAASVGPTGKLMQPFGDFTFEAARAIFAEQITARLDAGADILHFETFTDLSELRAAVIAAKEVDPGAPVIATLSFEAGGRTMMGDDARCAALALESLGVDCLGANCGLAPEAMLKMFGRFTGGGVPLCSKPNAGAPVVENGIARYGATVEEYYKTAFGFARLGARLIGGCCGSGPEHIKRLREAVDEMNACADDQFGLSAAERGGEHDPERGGLGAEWDAGQTIASFGRAFTFGKAERKALSGAVRQVFRGGGRDPKTGDGERGRKADGGGIDFVDLACLRARSADAREAAAIDLLSDADESDGKATVFCLVDQTRRGDGGREAAAMPGGAADAADILRTVAVNARSYHKKPLIFCVDESSALAAALSFYCGLAGVVLP
ncbi:MAG: homocysteine S-methyltransferase family protein, partial [Clostridiales bacterium]|nr:homocysteine S-methyltransferase family protein [Clostridiales bacterium]